MIADLDKNFIIQFHPKTESTFASVMKNNKFLPKIARIVYAIVYKILMMQEKRFIKLTYNILTATRFLYRIKISLSFIKLICK